MALCTGGERRLIGKIDGHHVEQAEAHSNLDLPVQDFDPETNLIQEREAA